MRPMALEAGKPLHEQWLWGMVIDIYRVPGQGRTSQDVRTEHPGLLLAPLCTKPQSHLISAPSLYSHWTSPPQGSTTPNHSQGRLLPHESTRSISFQC